MAIEAKITGNGAYHGSSTALSDYTYTEDATPLDPNSTNGGVGQLTITVLENPAGNAGTLALMNDTITLSDGSNGITSGVVSGISTTDGVSTVTADSRLSLLLNPTTALPFRGTISQVFTYYLGLANITTGIVFKDGNYRVSSSAVLSYPGWTANVWDQLRAWATSIGGEVTLVSNDVVLRPIRQRAAVDTNDTTVQSNVQTAAIAQTVQVNYYQNNYQVSGIAFPVPGGPDPNSYGGNPGNIYQVNVNERQVNNEPITATLLSVDQPVCVGNVRATDTISEYAVIDNTGNGMQPSDWTGNGGSVTVAIGADRASLDITVTGPSTALASRAPFRIAVQINDNEAAPAIQITGTGNFVNQQTLTLWTGADPLKTIDMVGTTVDNEFISTIDQAYQAGRITAAAYCGPDQSITVTSTNINRIGDSGSVAYPTFADFNTGVNNNAPVYTGQTFATFDSNNSGLTFYTFNQNYFSYVQADFTNQAFGNVGGARRKYRDAWYRVDSGSVSPTAVSYTASRDTLFNDFTTTWNPTSFERTGTNPKSGNYLFSDFDTIQSGRTFGDFAMTPLWRTYAGNAATQPH